MSTELLPNRVLPVSIYFPDLIIIIRDIDKIGAAFRYTICNSDAGRLFYFLCRICNQVEIRRCINVRQRIAFRLTRHLLLYHKCLHRIEVEIVTETAAGNRILNNIRQFILVVNVFQCFCEIASPALPDGSRIRVYIVHSI